jgi:hypothetical protein
MPFREKLTALLPSRQPAVEEPEPLRTRVITVRMPLELHELLKALAHDEKLSMNKLCVASLTAAAIELSEEHSQQALAAAAVDDGLLAQYRRRYPKPPLTPAYEGGGPAGLE